MAINKSPSIPDIAENSQDKPQSRSRILKLGAVVACLALGTLKYQNKETKIQAITKQILADFPYVTAANDYCLAISFRDDFTEVSHTSTDQIFGTTTLGISYFPELEWEYEFKPDDSPISTQTFYIGKRTNSTNNCKYSISNNGDTYVLLTELNYLNSGYNVNFGELELNQRNILLTIPNDPNTPANATRAAMSTNQNTTTRIYTYLESYELPQQVRNLITDKIQEVEARRINNEPIAAMYQAALNSKITIAPTVAQIALFREVFEEAEIQMYVYDANTRQYSLKEWLQIERIYAELSVNFARLAQALNIEPRKFAQQLRSAILQNNWKLKIVNNDEVSGTAPIGTIIVQGKISNPKLVSALTHEIIHQIFMDEITDENLRVSGLLTEGATELLTRIALNGQNTTGHYPERTLLTAALGEEFYYQYITKPNTYSRIVNVRESDNCTSGELINSRIEIAIRTFAEKWKIDYEKNKNLLHEIFFKRCKIPFSYEFPSITKLKELLDAAGVNWNEFLIAIAPKMDPSIIVLWKEIK